MRRSTALLPFTPIFTSAAPARRAFLARTGNINGDGAALKFLVVKLLDGLLGLLGRQQVTEGDENALAMLTRREREICDRLCEGLSDKAIAADLGIGPATVRTHLDHVFEKFGLHGRAALVAKLMRSAPG